MIELLVRCWICNKEVSEYDAKPVFTGRKKYVCLECDKLGQDQARARDMSIVRARQLSVKNK